MYLCRGPVGITQEFCLTHSVLAQLPMTSVNSSMSFASHAGHKHPNVDFAVAQKILCRTSRGVLQQKVFKIKLLSILPAGLLFLLRGCLQLYDERKDLRSCLQFCLEVYHLLDLPTAMLLIQAYFKGGILSTPIHENAVYFRHFKHCLKYSPKCRRRSGNTHSKGCIRVNYPIAFCLYVLQTFPDLQHS